MSKVINRVVRAAFVLGIVGAIGFGARTAVAAGQTLECLCVPPDHEFCEMCCNADGSVCPLGGSEPRECICA
jgi:hypothetical protein